MRKVLFLDIDGVLNRRGTKERCQGFIGCDRALARLLTDWLKAHPDVQVVLSSTWRNHVDMHQHLHDAGIHWVDITPRLNRDRGFDIDAFLNKNSDIGKFAILDDCSDMLPDQMAMLVQTDTDVGLTQAHLDQLTALLG